MDKKNALIVWGFVSVFLEIVLAIISMFTNPWCGLFALPGIAFIGYEVYKAAK